MWVWWIGPGGLNDVRVPVWQCLRYLSRLRWRMQQDAAEHGGVTIVAHVEDIGHMGVGGVSGQVEAVAREYAFLHKALGLKMV